MAVSSRGLSVPWVEAVLFFPSFSFLSLYFGIPNSGDDKIVWRSLSCCYLDLGQTALLRFRVCALEQYS